MPAARRTGVRANRGGSPAPCTPPTQPAKLRWLAAGPRSARRGGAPSTTARRQCWARGVTSISMASATGLFDQERPGLGSEMLDAAGLDGGGSSSRTRSGPDAPRAWGEPVARSSGARSGIRRRRQRHGQCGLRLHRSTRVAINVGTSSAMRLVTDARAARAWGWRTGWTPAAPSWAAPVGETCARWPALDSASRRVERALIAGPTPSTGYSGAPAPRGAAQPGLERTGSGAITGLSLATTPMDILRASLESVAFRLASSTISWRRSPRRAAEMSPPAARSSARRPGSNDRRCARPTARGGARAGVEPRRGPARLGRARPAGRSRDGGSRGTACASSPMRGATSARRPGAPGPAVRRAVGDTPPAPPPLPADRPVDFSNHPFEPIRARASRAPIRGRIG